MKVNKFFSFGFCAIFLFTACASKTIFYEKETVKSKIVQLDNLEIHLCGSKLAPRAWGNIEVYLRNGFIEKVDLAIFNLKPDSNYTIQLIYPEQELIWSTYFHTKSSGSGYEQMFSYARQPVHISLPKLITVKIYEGVNEKNLKDFKLAAFSSQNTCER